MVRLKDNEGVQMTFDSVSPRTSKLLALIQERSGHDSMSRLLDDIVDHAAFEYFDPVTMHRILEEIEGPEDETPSLTP